MAINYDFYKLSGHFADEQAERLYVRTVENGTVGTAEIVQYIQSGSSLTEGDVLAALSALSSRIAAALRDGKGIYLEGIGHFSARIGGEVRRNADGRLWLKDAAVRTVGFRPDKRLMARLRDAEITSKGHRGDHSPQLADEELRAVADKLLAAQGYFTATEFRQAAGLTRTTAYRWLRQAEKDGLLTNSGTPHAKIFKHPNP